MKKSLIALAALSTIAGSVAAQSSVTVYGRLDAGYRVGSSETAAGTKTDTTGVAQGGWTSNRLGITVSEDLGGGLKALGTVEMNMNIAGGTNGAAQAQTLSGTRQSFMGVQGGFGTLTIGQQYTPEYNITVPFVAGTTNAMNLNGTTNPVARAAAVANENLDSIVWVSPKIAKNFEVVLQAGSSSSKNNDTAEGSGRTDVQPEDTKIKLMAFGLNYKAGATDLRYAYTKADKQNAKTAGSTITNHNNNGMNGQPQTATYTYGVFTAAANTEQENHSFGASYNAGFARFIGYYVDRTGTDNLTGVKTDDEGYSVGVRVPVKGTKATAFVNYTANEQTASGTAGSTKKNGSQIGLNYDFSKRTSAYAFYADFENKAAKTTTVKKADQISLGLVHLF